MKFHTHSNFSRTIYLFAMLDEYLYNIFRVRTVKWKLIENIYFEHTIHLFPCPIDHRVEYEI